MSRPISEHDKMIQALTDAGFETGWALNDTELVVWEHKEDPPKPLKRPA
jgi:hypothetical protein